MMKISKHITCPKCNGEKVLAKYEATYVYSYDLDSNAPGRKNDEEFLSFLFDNREIKNSFQYLECDSCKARFPCSFREGNTGIDFTILQKAFRSDFVEVPELLE